MHEDESPHTRSNFDEVFEAVVAGDEHLILRHGTPVAVMVSADAYDELCAAIARA